MRRIALTPRGNGVSDLRRSCVDPNHFLRTEPQLPTERNNACDYCYYCRTNCTLRRHVHVPHPPRCCLCCFFGLTALFRFGGFALRLLIQRQLGGHISSDSTVESRRSTRVNRMVTRSALFVKQLRDSRVASKMTGRLGRRGRNRLLDNFNRIQLRFRPAAIDIRHAIRIETEPDVHILQQLIGKLRRVV